MSLLFEATPTATINYDETAQLVPQLVPDTSYGACPDLVQEIEARLARSISDDLVNVAKRRSSPFPLLNSMHPPSAHLPTVSSVSSAPGARRLSEALGQLLKHDLSAAELNELDSIVSGPDHSNPPIEAAATAAHGCGSSKLAPFAYYENVELDYTTAAAIQRMDGDYPKEEDPDALASWSSLGARPCRRRRAPPLRSDVGHTAPKAMASRSKAGKAGKAGTPSSLLPQHAAVDLACSPPLPLDPTGVLPADHRPARGRGRAQQLKSMTKAQIAAEAKAMREKNRAAARDLRLKRKEHEASLQTRVDALEAKHRESKRTIARLTAKLNRLERQ